MNDFIRFKSPTLIDDGSETCSLRLATDVDPSSIERIVAGLVDQIGARIVDLSGSGTTRTWALEYSDTSLRLVYDKEQLRLEAVYGGASCAIHDLHELLAIRSGPNGY